MLAVIIHSGLPHITHNEDKQKIKIAPFLKLPFNEINYKISAGWFYDPEDFITKVGGSNRHFAIDFELKKGTPVLAPAPGYAVCSYHHFLLRSGSDKRRFVRYRGKPIGSGQGNFVIIYHPKQNIFTQYGHLEKIISNIPFYDSKKKRSLVLPPVDRFQPSFFIKNNVLWIKQGEVIGEVGTSGIIGDWASPHLHFEVYKYRDKEGHKPEDSYIDPYDIYKISRYYPRPGYRKRIGKSHLWILDSEDLLSNK